MRPALYTPSPIAVAVLTTDVMVNTVSATQGIKPLLTASGRGAQGKASDSIHVLVGALTATTTASLPDIWLRQRVRTC
jgi:hypothetical protein